MPRYTTSDTMIAYWIIKALAWLIAFAIVLLCMFHFGVAWYFAALIGCVILSVEQAMIGAYALKIMRRSSGPDWNDAISAAQEARRIEEEMSRGIARDWVRQNQKKPPDKPL